MTTHNGHGQQDAVHVDDLPINHPTGYRRTPAKVNLGLFIKKRREDGYHELETVFLPVPHLYDELTISPALDEPEPVLLMSGRPIPGDLKDNLVLRAWLLLYQDYNDLPSVRIRLHKQIPAGAGLGGGSSNAAGMLLAMNELFDMQLSDEQLHHYAQQLGADVPFFLHNRPMHATGIGDELSPIALSEDFRIEVQLPPLFSDTPTAYRNLDLSACTINADLKLLLTQPLDSWQQAVKNDFEPEVFSRLPMLPKLKQAMLDKGAVYAAMSGSGSAIFGLFRT